MRPHKKKPIDDWFAGQNLIRVGEDWVVSSPLGRRAFLAEAEPRMASLIALYTRHCCDLLPPCVGDIGLTDLFATGMLSSTYRFDASRGLEGGRFAPWKAAAHLDGYDSALVRKIHDLNRAGPLLTVIRKALPSVLMFGGTAYFRLLGTIKGEPRLLELALLPLRTQQGQICECLVPLRDKLGKVPVHLRQELLTRHLDQV